MDQDPRPHAAKALAEAQALVVGNDGSRIKNKGLLHFRCAQASEKYLVIVDKDPRPHVAEALAEAQALVVGNDGSRIKNKALLRFRCAQASEKYLFIVDQDPPKPKYLTRI